jgi:hypothetical protein
MSLGFNNRQRLTLGRSGTSSLEFAIVVVPFVLIIIAGMDLGRYFLTQHSLRTLTSEAVRAMLIACYGATAACPMGSSDKAAVAAKVPFLVAGSISWPTANQSAPNASTGERTISVTVTYPFTFILPAWVGQNAGSPISESTQLTY